MRKLRKYLQKRLSQINEVRKEKTFVFIVSTMRSGSTLLKSMLANAPDTSYLPEVDFQKYYQASSLKLKTLSPKKIIILKKPSTFDQEDYPLIPKVQNAKVIILVRDVHDTVLSIKKMIVEAFPEIEEDWPDEKIVNTYWYETYKNILDKTFEFEKRLVRYEDLILEPKKITKELFEFIGSNQKEGVSTYKPPGSYSWEWGNDDGGEVIKSLTVKTNSKKINQKLKEIILKSEKVNELRNQFGYN